MAPTPHYNLPQIDENQTADVPRDYNALAVAVDQALHALKQAVDGGVTATGGEVAGKVEIVMDGEGLALTGERISYITYYPRGKNAGRKGVIGFGESSNYNLLIINEHPDADVVFGQKGKRFTLDSILNAESISNVMKPRAVPSGVTDLDQITETGFYEVDDITYTNVPENYTSNGGTYMMESFVLEVYAQPNGTIMQRATEVSGNGSHYRFKFNGQDTWGEWIGEEKEFIMQSEQIPTGITDLDRITEAGFYELSSTTTYSNIPTDVSGGMLIVYMHENGIGLQKLITATGDKKYYRTRPNIIANWNQWIEEGSSGGGTNPDTAAHIANNDIHVTAEEKAEWDAKLSPTGGDLTGKLKAVGQIEVDSGTTTQAIFRMLYNGVSKGALYYDNATDAIIMRKHASPKNFDMTIKPDGDVVFPSGVSVSDLSTSYRARTATPGVTDLNQYTTTGFYQLGAAAGYQNIPQGLDWTILEVKAHPSGYIIQRITSVTTQKRYFRTRTEQTDGWSQWIDISAGGSGMSQVMIPSANVRHNDAKEYTYALTSRTGYIKIFDMQPKMKGSFKISAEVTFSGGMGGIHPAEIIATSANGSNNRSYISGIHDQGVINSFYLPIGTSTTTPHGEDVSYRTQGGFTTNNVNMTQDVYNPIEINVAMAGHYPVSVYAGMNFTNSSYTTLPTFKVRNIRVSYDLV